MICTACHSTEARVRFTATDRLYRTTARQFQVVECAGCGLLRLDPPPAALELGDYYPKNYWYAPDGSAAGALEEAWRRLVLRDHLRFVERALAGSTARGTVLDVGCGGGLFLRMLRTGGRRAVGLDNSVEAARVCWRQNSVAAVQSSLEQAPLRPASCGAITMFHVLEHLYDFRARDLERILEDCGFVVVRRKHFSLRDNPAGMASSIAPGLDPMARRVRGVAEASGVKLLKDLVYLALLAACLPFTLAEAACGAGSTIMIEARPR